MEVRLDLQEIVENKIAEKIIECNDIFDNVNSSVIYQELKNKGFIQISAPQEEPPMMHMLTIDSLKNYNQGNSIKPGNIRLNLKQLIDTIPSIIELAISIVTDIPILQICAALNIWKIFRDAITVQITKEQAFVIVALWKNCNINN